MNTPSHADVLDPRTDAELRALDPASAAPLTADGRAHADALFAAIVATDPMAPAAHGTPGTLGTPGATAIPSPAISWRRRPVVRWACAAAGLAAATTAGLALSTTGAPAAYATWTATPAQVAAADNALVEKACREQAGDIAWFGNGTLAVRLAERRGNYVAMLLTGTGTNAYGPTSASVTCLGRLPAGGTEVQDLSVATGGGSAGEGYDPRTDHGPAGAEVREGAMSQFDMGANWLGQGGQPASFVEGRLGPDVIKLTIHAFDGRSVEASLKDGTYAAWWPGAVFAPETMGGPSGEGGPRAKLTYDLVLKDGTVRHGVSSTMPTS